MSISEVSQIMHTAIFTAAKIAAPILLSSMAVGVVISIIQAATQINEQTITFIPKLIIIGLMLMFTGGWIMQSLVDFTRYVFGLML